MTTMSVIDVVNLDYPDQFNIGNIGFGQDGNGPIFITKWTVPNVAQPSMQQLIDRIPQLQNQFDLNYFKTVGQDALQEFLNVIAMQRKYSSAVSCASYFNSSDNSWKSEAEAFVAWRDNVFIYTIAQIQLMENLQRTVPSFEEFQAELPEMVWPD